MSTSNSNPSGATPIKPEPANAADPENTAIQVHICSSIFLHTNLTTSFPLKNRIAFLDARSRAGATLAESIKACEKLHTQNIGEEFKTYKSLYAGARLSYNNEIEEILKQQLALSKCAYDLVHEQIVIDRLAVCVYKNRELNDEGQRDVEDQEGIKKEERDGEMGGDVAVGEVKNE